MTFSRWLALGCLVLVVVYGGRGAVAASAPPALPDWTAPLGRDHPLTGLIVKPADGGVVDQVQLVRDAITSPFVLLGEKHDNPDHHALQAWVIGALAANGRRPAIAMEMLAADQAPALARYLAGPDADAAGLGKAVDWQAQGWPDWSIYAPIAEAAFRARLPMVAADLAKAMRRPIGRGELGSLPDGTRARLDLARDYDAQQAASLARELRDSHCGQLPDGAVPGMAAVQRARDAHMAAAMADAAAQPGIDGAVLIAGAGHVRRDRGVPWHLARMAPGRKMLTIAFREVDEEKPDAGQYVTAGTFDYIWFTPRLDDEDPCARFEEQLRRLRRP